MSDRQPMVQQYRPTQKELNKLAKKSIRTLRRRIKSGNLGRSHRVI